jgi:copper transport protein
LLRWRFHGRTRRWLSASLRERLAAGALSICLLLASAAIAEAHAVLVRSDPAYPCAGAEAGGPRSAGADPRCVFGAVVAAPPSEVRLWFSEPVEPFAGGIDVRGPSGARVQRGSARSEGAQLSVPVDATEPGTYVVSWRVLSADAHPVRGGFVFSVGYGSATAAPAAAGDLGAVSRPGLVLQVLARWLHFAGFALGFGSIAFLALVLVPLTLPAEQQVSGRLLRIAGAGVLLLILAELLSLVAETTSLTAGAGLSPDLIAEALASSFGRVFAQRIAAALLLWTLLAVIERGSKRALWAAVAVGAGLAFVDGEASHAGSGAPLWLGAAANAAHLIAMAFWAGGIVALIAVWALPEVRSRRAAVLRRFGRMAVVAVLVLVISGTTMAVAHVPRLALLRATPYGLALTIKLAVVLFALATALLASRVRLPSRPRVWSVEIVVLAAVLALAGLMVSLPPPR